MGTTEPAPQNLVGWMRFGEGAERPFVVSRTSADRIEGWIQGTEELPQGRSHIAFLVHGDKVEIMARVISSVTGTEATRVLLQLLVVFSRAGRDPVECFLIETLGCGIILEDQFQARDRGCYYLFERSRARATPVAPSEGPATDDTAVPSIRAAESRRLRAENRYNMSVPLHFSDGRMMHTAVAENVSSQGLMIRTRAESVLAGSKVTVHFPIASGSVSFKVPLECRVRWSEALDAGVSRLGLSIELDENGDMRWQDYLEGYAKKAG